MQMCAVCPGLTSLWQWFIARLGYSWALQRQHTSEPQFRSPGCPRILLWLWVVGGALSRCMPWSAPLATHSRSSGGAERSAACTTLALNAPIST